MHKSILAFVGALAASAALAAPPGASAVDRDCADFASQRQAQIFFLRHGGPRRDRHRLDADDNGIACETLRCPCYRKKRLPDRRDRAKPGQAKKPRPCGSRVIETAIGPRRLYFRASPWVSCQTAHRVVRNYFRLTPDRCVGSGCFIRLVSGWECHTASAGVEERYGTVTSCSRRDGRSSILTSRYRNRGFHPSG